MFGRIRCHFCGSKQPHDKSITEFRCSECEAPNFFDGKGNVIDTPASVAAACRESRPATFTRALPETLDHQQQQTFCRTCSLNQLLYNQTLANYLPDESHPHYKQSEVALPSYKQELEKRYPLVCKSCAPEAQSIINRADSHAMKDNVARLCADTKRRNGQPARRIRDDSGKKFMRILLRLAGFILTLGILTQAIYHAYIAFSNLIDTNGVAAELMLNQPHNSADYTSSPILPLTSEFALQPLRPRFTAYCFRVISTLVPYTLATAFFGLWYNPGLIALYDHTRRIEAVSGKKSYFSMQFIVLAVRCLAWFSLSDSMTALRHGQGLTVGLHAFTVVFLLVTQWIAGRSIKLIVWRIKGNIMPKPSEDDFFGATAGPSIEHFTPKASGRDPLRYLRKQDDSSFDINSLSPHTARKKSAYPRTSYAQQPSPDLSDDEDGSDAMEIDYKPATLLSQRVNSTQTDFHPRNSFSASSLSFGGMTEQVLSMQEQLRQEQERRRVEHEQKLRFRPPPQQNNPFYGKLPPAPVSMERRLRNPLMNPVEPQKVPLSQQKGFMQQMRTGLREVQFPERGSNFELKRSTWVLPTDQKSTGLEERFGTNFTLADPAPGDGAATKQGFLGGLFGL